MAAPPFVAAGTGGASGSLPAPSGVVSGDLLVAVLSIQNVFTNDPLTGPSGWTRSSVQYVSGYQAEVWYKVASASEPGSYAWSGTHAGSATGRICAWRNAVVDAFTAGTIGNYASPYTAPSVTTTAADTRVIRIFTSELSSWSTPTSHTSRATSPGVFDVEQSAAGASGTADSTPSSSSPGTDQMASFTMAIANANTAPNAPTLLTPIGGATVDKDTDQVFDWSFSDPDAGDTQSAYEFRYKLSGAGSWTTTGQVASTSTQLTLAGGTLAAGTYEWQVKTWDQDGEPGTFSASETVVAAAAPSPPTITDPLSGGTVNTNPYTVAWSTPVQTAYQVRTVADAAGSPDTGTVYTDTGEITSTSRSASVAFATQQWEHVQVRVRSGGLWSSWASHRVNVSYTPPPTPTFTLTADSTVGSITVAITNPAPGAGEPDVTGNDVYRQTVGTSDGVRVAADVAPNGSYVDWLVAHRTEYEYWVTALGDNGTTTTSAVAD